MLQKMNLSVIEHQKKEDMKNTPEPKYYQWYSDLENLVVAFYSRDDCILGKLLDKLSPYGKVNFFHKMKYKTIDIVGYKNK
jgi:hypothetical protein